MEQPKGVLDKSYAVERLQKPELNFRFKVRAYLVKNCIASYLTKQKEVKVIDFGAAEGLTMLEMHKLIPGSEFSGIEYSTDLIEQSPDLPSNIKLEQGDVTKLENIYCKGEYDCVSALALLEHLKEPILALKEAYKALKPGGLFIASSPNPFWDHISTKLGLLRDEQHEVEMNKRVMKQLMKEAGFNIVGFKRFMWAPVSFLPYLKINVSPSFSLKIDSLVRKFVIFNWLFVNQAIIGKKPLS